MADTPIFIQDPIFHHSELVHKALAVLMYLYCFPFTCLQSRVIKFQNGFSQIFSDSYLSEASVACLFNTGQRILHDKWRDAPFPVCQDIHTPDVIGNWNTKHNVSKLSKVGHLFSLPYNQSDKVPPDKYSTTSQHVCGGSKTAPESNRNLTIQYIPVMSVFQNIGVPFGKSLSGSICLACRLR